MSESLQHAVIILAAGASRRLGVAKQLVTMNGESLINRTIRMALDTHAAQTLVVLGHRADEIFASISHESVVRVDCNDWHTGMGASLRAGIQRVDVRCTGALILLCDQPALNAPHLLSVISAWHKQPDRAVASAYANTVGVPALLPRSSFENILAVRGDQGAREWLRHNPNLTRIDAPELVQDVDLPRDLLHDLQ